jgi:alkanesulfonate monooxygenase SsuD/methylene tetrahydromethanopterin reductase-like flavin-dependent oxidoreductase (luciferase family)
VIDPNAQGVPVSFEDGRTATELAQVGRRSPGARLGVTVACDAREALQCALHADRAGLDDVWTTEFCHRSALVPMGAIAARSRHVRIGSAIAYAFARSPMILAAEMRDVDALSDGRAILGLGTGQPARQKQWMGIDPARAAERMAELVPLLRRLWRLDGGAVVHEGRHYQVRVTPTGDVPEPCVPNLRVYIAAVNSRMLKVAGTVADGVITHPLAFAAVDTQVRPVIERAAEQAGREAPVVTTMVISVVDDDRGAARSAAAAQLAFYAQHATYEPLLASQGFGNEAAAIRSAAARGDWQDMVGAVTDEMVDRLSITGGADEVRGRVQALTLRSDEIALHTPSMLHLRPTGTALSGNYGEQVRRLVDAVAPLTKQEGAAHDRP